MRHDIPLQVMEVSHSLSVTWRETHEAIRRQLHGLIRLLLRLRQSQMQIIRQVARQQALSLEAVKQELTYYCIKTDLRYAVQIPLMHHEVML